MKKTFLSTDSARSPGALDGAGQKAFHAALLDLLSEFSRSKNGALVVPGDHLEVVVTK